MGDVIVGVHQPNFFPWFGYFLKITRSDKFVYLDDAQISNSRSYINRTYINIKGQAKWLTVPIKRTNAQQIINKTKWVVYLALNQHKLLKQQNKNTNLPTKIKPC